LFESAERNTPATFRGRTDALNGAHIAKTVDVALVVIASHDSKMSSVFIYPGRDAENW
jgi:hypothetical protein